MYLAEIRSEHHAGTSTMGYGSFVGYGRSTPYHGNRAGSYCNYARYHCQSTRTRNRTTRTLCTTTQQHNTTTTTTTTTTMTEFLFVFSTGTLSMNTVRILFPTVFDF